MQDITKKQYWNNLYEQRKIGWDVGYVSPPLKEYFDQITDKTIKILVPGAGSSWEVEYLHNLGFTNVFLLDFAENSIITFKKRCNDFPENRIIYQDFFEHSGKYDLIVEQTFFSSFHPEHRLKFTNKISDLLADKGKYMGLLFNHEFNFTGPPFGGSPEEYSRLFADKFKVLQFETAYNSIKPRKSRELFILLRKK